MAGPFRRMGEAATALSWLFKIASAMDMAASRAREPFIMSVNLPSGSLIRYMPGQRSSGMIE
jgi:hypothetical protein